MSSSTWVLLTRSSVPIARRSIASTPACGRNSRRLPRPPGTTLPDPCTIRDYRDADESAVLAIIHDLQRHERAFESRLKSPEEIGSWYIRELLASVEKHKGRLLVAEANGLVAGYACLLVDVSSADQREEILYSYSQVSDLAVLSTHRGLGLGQALIAACEGIARGQGQKWIRLGVLAANQDARRFYARSGFSEMWLTLEKGLT